MADNRCDYPCDADCDTDCHQEHLPQHKRHLAACRCNLRRRYAEALATWAIMYPISAWRLAEGSDAEQLARNWGEGAAKFAMDVQNKEMERLREELDAALAKSEAALAAARDLCARSPLCVPGDGQAVTEVKK